MAKGKSTAKKAAKPKEEAAPKRSMTAEVTETVLRNAVLKVLREKLSDFTHTERYHVLDEAGKNKNLYARLSCDKERWMNKRPWNCVVNHVLLQSSINLPSDHEAVRQTSCESWWQRQHRRRGARRRSCLRAATAQPDHHDPEPGKEQGDQPAGQLMDKRS